MSLAPRPSLTSPIVRVHADVEGRYAICVRRDGVPALLPTSAQPSLQCSRITDMVIDPFCNTVTLVMPARPTTIACVSLLMAHEFGGHSVSYQCVDRDAEMQEALRPSPAFAAARADAFAADARKQAWIESIQGWFSAVAQHSHAI